MSIAFKQRQKALKRDMNSQWRYMGNQLMTPRSERMKQFRQNLK